MEDERIAGEQIVPILNGQILHWSDQEKGTSVDGTRADVLFCHGIPVAIASVDKVIILGKDPSTSQMRKCRLCVTGAIE